MVDETTVNESVASPEPVTQPGAAPAPEPKDLVAELEQTKAALEEARKVSQGHERAVSRLANEKSQLEQKLVAKLETLERKTELSNALQSGRIDEATYNNEVAKIQQAQQTQIAQTVREDEKREALESIAEAFKDAGIDPNSTDPEVLKVRETFEEAWGGGKSLVSAVRLAEKLARDTFKKKAPSEKDIEKRVLEGLKRTPAYQVSTAAPDAVASSTKEMRRKYAQGEISTEEYDRFLNK